MRQIVAVGGDLLTPGTASRALCEYILAATGKPRPRVCFVGTASGDDAGYRARFYQSFGDLDCRTIHLPFFERTPADVRAFVLACDAIAVGGGNTRSMLAVWREWGLDAILREAWERGIVLCGSSAGAICWFDAGLTDSIVGDLVALPCLGFLPGSACPHYDGESDRRPIFRRRVAAGELPRGIALDNGVGAHFHDGELHAVVSARSNARAYRVERTGNEANETPLPTTPLVT